MVENRYLQSYLGVAPQCPSGDMSHWIPHMALLCNLSAPSCLCTMFTNYEDNHVNRLGANKLAIASCPLCPCAYLQKLSVPGYLNMGLCTTGIEWPALSIMAVWFHVCKSLRYSLDLTHLFLNQSNVLRIQCLPYAISVYHILKMLFQNVLPWISICFCIVYFVHRTINLF